MDLQKSLRQEISALLRGGNAHLDFEEVVSDFPVTHINAKAPQVPYSFWQMVEHMRIAQWDILEFIRNPAHVSPHYPEGYRPNPEKRADEELWRKTLDDFRSDLEALDAMVQNPETHLFAPIPHAPNYTVFREILLAADHNSYHLGELAIIRQVLDLWPADRKYLTGAPQ
ncbi:MAG: DinB family protein [Syntrophobacteraceae bacterium]|nr:DinB family protein [Syntrophobacteraceae bacterium]